MATVSSPELPLLIAGLSTWRLGWLKSLYQQIWLPL